MLRDELIVLLNKTNSEKESNTPDYILANFLLGCLQAFERATVARSKWFGNLEQKYSFLARTTAQQLPPPPQYPAYPEIRDVSFTIPLVNSMPTMPPSTPYEEQV